MNALALFSGPYALLARFGVVVLVALSCMAFGAWKMHEYDSVKYENLEHQFSMFKADVAGLGKAAEVAKKKREEFDQRNKKETDDEHAKTVASLAADIARLRSATDTSRRGLPSPPTASKRPDLLCLDRETYQREDGEAIARLFEGARRLADEGTTSTVELNAAKKWALRLDKELK